MPASVLYIHGFASCGSGNKSQVLREHYGDNQVVSPDLPVSPDEALRQLAAIVEHESISLLIGSSLGGYYAECLNHWYQIPAVLINPSTRPFDTLADYLGENTNWCTDEVFEWKTEYLQQLKNRYRQKVPLSERYLVLLQTADEVLDYRLAANRFRQHRVVIEQGGNHRFENLADYLALMDEFVSAS